MKPVGILMGALVLAGCAGTHEPAPKPAASACAKTSFTIYFDKNDTTLTEPAQAVVADTARRLQGCAINGVRVVGLADAGGSPAQNLELSATRAARVVEAFAAYGWPKPSFEVAAGGSSGATTPSGEAKPLRRRVEVFVDAGPKG